MRIQESHFHALNSRKVTQRRKDTMIRGSHDPWSNTLLCYSNVQL